MNKKFWQRLMIILLPIGIIYAVGKALFYRGDFVTFLGCLSIGLISFICGGVLIYYHPGIIEPIETFIVSIWGAIKALFS